MAIDVFIVGSDYLTTDNSFSQSVDWDQFREGEHTLRVELIDGRGNIANDSTLINIGEEQIDVKIINPKAKTYMQSSAIPIKYTPGDMGLTAKIDGVIVENNTKLEAIDYSLGEHIFTIEKDGKVLASRIFKVDTNLKDMEKITQLLYKDRHIKKNTVRLSILSFLKSAQFLDKIGWIGFRNYRLRTLESYIIYENQRTKPTIDDYARDVLVGDIEWIILNK
jgi:hypothetical protein